jgi:hypothetical protein
LFFNQQLILLPGILSIIVLRRDLILLPGPKEFRSNVRDTCFPNHFQAPNNIVKYDGKTNPSVWLEDYRLACMTGGANNNIFITQFLPIYLADTSRAWLDHLPMNSID